MLLVRRWVLLLIVLLMIPFQAVFAEPGSYVRIAGTNRYETAVEISEESFPYADTVILASGENFADALAAGPLASYCRAPVLLVQKDQVPEVVVNEVNRLGALDIIVVGGESQVSPEALQQAFPSRNIKRIAGSDRYQTSLLVAAEMNATQAGFANGMKFPDSLSAGPYLGKKSVALILTNGKGLPVGSENYAATVQFGGESSMNIPQLDVQRIAGTNRYLTSLAIAKDGYPDTSTVIMASGTNFPDALAAISLANLYNAPILLTDGSKLQAEVEDWIHGKHVIFVGGTGTIPWHHVLDIMGYPLQYSLDSFRLSDGYALIQDADHFIKYARSYMNSGRPDTFKVAWETTMSTRDKMNLIVEANRFTYWDEIRRKLSCSDTGTYLSCDIDYRMTQDEWDAVEESSKALAERVEEQTGNAKEQMKAVYDHISQSYRYDDSYTNYDPYRLITEGKGVCQAFAAYYGRVLEFLGFPVRYASGYASSGPDDEPGRHAWVEVLLGGRWYASDVTWSGGPNGYDTHYDYFFMTLDEAAETHTKE